MTISTAREAFQDELVAAGLLVPAGVAGLYLRSGEFEDVIDGVDGVATRLGRQHLPADVWRLRLPPVVARGVFERTDYLASFPNLIGSISTFTGGDPEHAALLALHERGGDWTTALQPAETMLVPAACHAVYPLLAGDLPAGGKRLDVLGYCFRHEPSADPARMQSFRMREFVRVGSPDEAESHRDAWVGHALGALLGLGLDARKVEANDPFFGRAGRMLAANQRQQTLKYELVVPLYGDAEDGTAVVSSNYHQDHFGANFGIRTADDEVAHSACVGFGLERTALALFRTHGLAVSDWPASVRDQLWP